MKLKLLVLNIVALLALAGWTLAAAPTWSQAAQEPEQAEVQEQDDSNAKFPIARRIWLKLTGHEPEIDSLGAEDLKKRPFAFWRVWANRALPVVPAVAVLLFCTICADCLIPERLSTAEQYCRNHFWRAIGRGFLAVVIALIPTRPLFMSEVGSPLALLIIGVLQLGLIIGFAVTAQLVGASIVDRVGLAKAGWMVERPRVARVIKITLGVILLGCLLLIPGIGRLPRVGVRLLMFTAVLGLGGLLKTNWVLNPCHNCP